MIGGTEVKLTLKKLVRNRTQTVQIPDLKNRHLVLNSIALQNAPLPEEGHFPVEVKVLSNGNSIMTAAPAYLKRNGGLIVLNDRFLLENASNLTLQVKSRVSDNFDLDISLQYVEHPGYPLCQTDLTVLANNDENNFWDPVLRELKKIELTKIEFLPDCGKETAETLTITDPYTFQLGKPDNELQNCRVLSNYSFEVKGDHGVFVLDSSTLERKLNSLNDLGRGKITFYNSDGDEFQPNSIGVIIYGFQKGT